MKPSLKSIDLFKRLPKDLTEGSYMGAVISIGCILIIVSLCMVEFSAFFDDKVASVLKIEQIDPNMKVQINIDIDFPAWPWDVISLDIQDEMGSHIVDSHETLKKVRRNAAKGATDIRMNAVGNANVNDAFQRAKSAFESGEGCSLKGFINMNRVESNFHIGGHAYRQLLMMLGRDVNLTHTINHLSFGRRNHITTIQDKFKGRYGELAPLNGRTEVSERGGKSTNYQFDIVPSVYRDRIGFKYPVFQYSYAVGSEYTGNEVIYFKLGFSGVTVNYYQTADSLLQFMTGIWMIIGGVFTVAGLLTILLNKSMNVLYKQEIGKKD